MAAPWCGLESKMHRTAPWCGFYILDFWLDFVASSDGHHPTLAWKTFLPPVEPPADGGFFDTGNGNLSHHGAGITHHGLMYFWGQEATHSSGWLESRGIHNVGWRLPRRDVFRRSGIQIESPSAVATILLMLIEAKVCTWWAARSYAQHSRVSV